MIQGIAAAIAAKLAEKVIRYAVEKGIELVGNSIHDSKIKKASEKANSTGDSSDLERHVSKL